MNKHKRKIRLSRESIRLLTSDQLDGLAGGAITSTVCPSGDACPFPSQGPCTTPCAASEGLRCF